MLIASIVPYMLKTADNPNGVDQSVFDEAGAGHQGRPREVLDRLLQGLLRRRAPSRSPVSDEVLDWSRDVSMQAGLKATLGCAKAFATTDFRPDLPSFTRPDADHPRHRGQDRADRRLGAPAAAGIAGSKLIEYDGAPHGLLASHKDAADRRRAAIYSRLALPSRRRRTSAPIIPGLASAFPARRVPEIQYLRAIAVVAVILHHLGLAASGFIGVDIFFVISGFVISQALYHSDRTSLLASLRHFYYRRIIRILPPLMVVTLASLLLGWWLFFDQDLKPLQEAVASQALFLQNVHFVGAVTDYFRAIASTQLTLHLVTGGRGTVLPRVPDPLSSCSSGRASSRHRSGPSPQ